MFAGLFGALLIGALQRPEQLIAQRTHSQHFELNGSAALDIITFASPLPRHRLRKTNVTLEKEERAPADNNVALLLDRVNGGSVLFDMVVRPSNQNYITVKFWGDTPLINGTAFVKQQNTW